ncbi:gamma carbonic anhydrase family protein [Candidatus Bathyarchaeota archaeon]|jgi:carbonic anhydrase/acetyltransferase-like protein (isoleucine patch superfamily)|nr:gamma carbonic anhydrase family protein [Candidatus Bathyarchaeota archaeon]
MLSIIEFEGKKPKVHPSVFLAPGSWVIGDVTLGEDVNVWTNAVIRGDDDTVVIGARTTVLEGCLIEAPTGNPVEIGEDVIISHGATVHGARIEDGCIVGIGAIVLDNAKIGSRSIIGSGALVSPRTEIPENQLVLGVPAKPVRECKDAEHQYMAKEHERTLSKAKVYKKIYAQG